MTEPKKRTTAKIRETLLKMLETTPLDDITVTALCDGAKINRATFYYHYNSVREVFVELEKKLEIEFYEFLSNPTINEKSMPEKSFYVCFFEFVARNTSLCRMILNSPHKTEDSFLVRAMMAGRDKVVSVMSALYPNCPVSKIDHYYLFVSHGFLGLLTYWLNSGMREPISSIAEIGEAVSHRGEKYLAE